MTKRWSIVVVVAAACVGVGCADPGAGSYDVNADGTTNYRDYEAERPSVPRQPGDQRSFDRDLADHMEKQDPEYKRRIRDN